MRIGERIRTRRGRLPFWFLFWGLDGSFHRDSNFERLERIILSKVSIILLVMICLLSFVGPIQNEAGQAPKSAVQLGKSGTPH